MYQLDELCDLIKNRDQVFRNLNTWKVQNSAKIVDSVVASLIGLINTPSFKLDMNYDLNFDTAALFDGIKFLVPFKEFSLVVKSATDTFITHVLVTDNPGSNPSLTCHSFGKIGMAGNEWGVSMPFKIIKGKAGLETVILDRQHYLDASESEIAGVINLGVCFCAALVALSKKTEVVYKAAPARPTTLMAVAKEKKPSFEYKLLKLDSINTRLSQPNQGGTHASPKWHLRRGHFKTMKKTGKQYFVKACEVGQKMAGMVLKDYMVPT